MAFCPQCGKEVAQGSPFCASCGAPQNVAAPGPTPMPGAAPAPGTQTGLQPNVAALLSYVLGWLSGLIFFFIEKDKFVRFHAMQSIITFGGIQIIQWVVIRILFGFSVRLWVIGSALSSLLWIGELILLVLLIVKAYNGERYKLPFVGDLAEKYSQQIGA